ncbi:hypothetical protein [Parachitinimonas caeni]|uniref:Uncharacterized protein n=1 Tax=Parachitinimonas caeni TaxID=3031301 RepID=A0ABT7E390_9NEIS|nr:hypothetical protein [Parachitinimonas caeni]MDK2126770.1 hypothetical protein [Parachitinimonas caeni]
MSLHTIAYHDVLLACVKDGDDLEAALLKLETNAHIKIDRSEMTVHRGLLLVDAIEDSDEVVWQGSKLGFLTDEHGRQYEFAVRRP